MKTHIKKLSHDRYTVNGKLIVKDMNDNWIGHQELTTQEVSLFQKHIQETENCHPEPEN